MNNAVTLEMIRDAREALKGNTLPIIAGMLLSALVFVMLQNIMYVLMIAFDAIDLESELYYRQSMQSYCYSYQHIRNY